MNVGFTTSTYPVKLGIGVCFNLLIILIFVHTQSKIFYYEQSNELVLY